MSSANAGSEDAKNEYRKDYLLDRWVIITANRGKRPHEFVKKAEQKGDSGTCFFCPGNEHLTPPEIDRMIDVHGKWLVRCFPNKFNAVDVKFPKAYGMHEIIVETPKHGERVSDLSRGHMKKVVEMYARRTEALMRNRKIKYVMIFKNEGPAAGASIAHTHTQLVSMDRVAPLLRMKMDAVRKNSTRRVSAHDEIWKGEKRKKVRIVSENDDFIAFCPYAPRFAFETWIYCKKPRSRLVDLDAGERASFAASLLDVMGRLDRLLAKPDYNFYLYSTPAKDGNFRFHLEIAPRLNVWAGFEFGAEVYLNSMAPEKAAEALRGA
jgi:UDPglucose--hexose-1-phosphate uridylyltransferase